MHKQTNIRRLLSVGQISSTTPVLFRRLRSIGVRGEDVPHPDGEVLLPQAAFDVHSLPLLVKDGQILRVNQWHTGFAHLAVQHPWTSWEEVWRKRGYGSSKWFKKYNSWIIEGNQPPLANTYRTRISDRANQFEGKRHSWLPACASYEKYQLLLNMQQDQKPLLFSAAVYTSWHHLGLCKPSAQALSRVSCFSKANAHGWVKMLNQLQYSGLF